jgi:hypothetical protein
MRDAVHEGEGTEESSMPRKLRTWIGTAIAATSLGATGCQTIGTAAMTEGEATADVAKAAGGAVATAARGAGRIVRNTFSAADDELH